jgi:RNA polymerase sigma factor (sigma-70 family)
VSDSFDDFFRAEFALLVAFLIKAGFVSEAEDAAAEAMLCAHRAWGSQRKPKAWLYKAAYRTAVRLGKQSRRSIPSGITEGRLTQIHHDSSLLSQIEEEPLVAAMLKCLPDQQRLVMALHLHDFSHQEIAEHLEKSVSTVRSTLRHARRTLKAELERRGPSTGGQAEEVGDGAE